MLRKAALMSKLRMLVTGANGMVGSYVPEVFADWDLIYTDTEGGMSCLDVRDPSSVRKYVSENRPDFVLHLAAATDVDRCEQDPDWAYHVNTLGTQNVAIACQAAAVPLVYISTSAVFEGNKPEPYTELDEPRPANVYGHTKLAGEHIVSSLLDQYYIIRAGWMVGGAIKDKKFVGKIVNLIKSGKKEISVINDKLGSPTYAKDLMFGVKTLIQTGYFGLYHMVNKGNVSRFDVACFIKQVLNKTNVAIVPISSSYFPLPAPRARSEAMRNLKLELLGINCMRNWEEAIREYLRTEMKF